MKEEVTSGDGNSMVLPVLISGVVGAGLALLLTPKSGGEIRHDIGRLAKRRGGQAQETLEEAKAAVSEAVQTGQESVAEVPGGLAETAGGGKALIVPILVSGVIGAAVALLFAPKSGRETMEDIKEAASSAFEKSKNLYEQGATAVKEAFEKGKAAAEQREKLRPAA